MSGEGVWIDPSGEAHPTEPERPESIYGKNPFLQLSGTLLPQWNAEELNNGMRQWRHLLETNVDSEARNVAPETDEKEKAEIMKSPPTKQEVAQLKRKKENLFLQHYLNAILPPIPMTVKDNNDNNVTAFVPVSTQNVSRMELQQLSQAMEALIKLRCARNSGLDSIRLQLAMQLFDECIRQAALDCKERALLLLRIRDEAKVTLEAYRLLQNKASVFSINQDVKSEPLTEGLPEKISALQSRKIALQKKLLQLQNEKENTEKRVHLLSEAQKASLNKHKLAVQQIGTQLEDIIEIKRNRGGSPSRRRMSMRANPAGRQRRTTTANKASYGRATIFSPSSKK